VPGIQLVVYDCTLHSVPDMPARPLNELAGLARQANAHCDEARYALAGRDFGAVLSELHVHVATGRRAALAALVEACLAASGTVRALGPRRVSGGHRVAWL